MLLAHQIELRPTAVQAAYLNRACGARRHCFNQLLAHFKQDGVKWSKAAAYQYYLKRLRLEFPWYTDVSSRITRNAIDDLDNAFKHFFRRVKAGQKSGFPVFKKKGIADSFALREVVKFDVNGRRLRIEKLATRIKMRQKLRFSGDPKQLTISKRAGKFFVSIVVETPYPKTFEQAQAIVGVDFGIKNLATLSTGEIIPANQKLKANLKRLRRKGRNLSRKQAGSNRRVKAKLRLARWHWRIATQRHAVVHELSDRLTRTFKVIVIEDLNVKGMTKNRKLSRAVNDAGFGLLRQMLHYKAAARGVQLLVADRWFPSTRLCNACGQLHNMPLSRRTLQCDCGNTADRDTNAAQNLEHYGRSTLLRDLKRTPELNKTASVASTMTV